MRRFDDRFARQNRCEPPPEFPLASPYPRIVHHLSGPNSYALTQIHPKTSGSVDDAPRRALTSVHFHYACAFLGPPKGITLGAITLPKELRSPGLYPPKRADAGLNQAKCTGENTG
ncbi:hypothetical protein F4813DRAFT_394761 [Daldinia decipiens]|nr:hypothetical protein F4813DRAFT_394761 [Daldinia decipiens]